MEENDDLQRSAVIPASSVTFAVRQAGELELAMEKVESITRDINLIGPDGRHDVSR